MEFETLFKTWFKPLGQYILPIVRDRDAVEDILQDVFLKLWEKRDQIQIDSSVKAYLYRAAYNTAINYLDKQKRESNKRDGLQFQIENTPDAVQEDPRAEKLRRIISTLPPRCRSIFILNKFEGYKYKEISERLDISIKTVENQMGKALKVLRDGLLSLILLFLFH